MHKTVIKSFIIFTVLSTLFACNNSRQAQVETETETVSEEKPFTVQIIKERSYYQARKIQERLLNLGVDAYLIATQDPVEREWYNVMSGAFVDSLGGVNHVHSLDSVYRLKKCFVINSKNLTDTFSIITKNIAKEYKVEENKRIEANTPAIPQEVLDVTEKFPDNNMFYLEKINILNLADNRTLQNIANNVNMDMPRGITLWKVSKFCNSISEVQYRDNIFEDKVTISIMKVKPNYDLDTDLVFEKNNVDKPAENIKTYSLALVFSADILNSGKYDNVDLKNIKIRAFKELYGYKVGLTTNKGVYRSYFVLADTDCEYLIIAQSIEKTEEEMQEILAETGKSEGLNDYDEFYNNFYILPDKPEYEDIFLGYSIDKLTWNYAKERGYTNWSKAMVGHWNVNAYFYNTKKGLWSYGLFDLLTPSSQSYIYGTLYSGHMSRDKTKTDAVYGVRGYFVDYMDYRQYRSAIELNFGIGRYVFVINSAFFNRQDMLKRAEKMQFSKGGYLPQI